ncbi:MAG: carboxypeptidase-like regulatory domain-containing protein, partial [Muribaculaceae bacterium]|nr:carboxypeptidase-like regulatory domain-containing protein [Muribaculaceae bacterium]
MKRMVWCFCMVIVCVLGVNSVEAGIVKGTVYSAEDEGVIIGAEVTALVDSVQTLSARTGNRGSFSLDVPDGASRCTLTVSSTGYEPHTLSVANLSGDVDLGRILLAPLASTLGEVSVTASTTRVIDLPDKSIVFPTQLEKDRATDPLNLLAQISYAAPSLSVDEHGRSMTIDGRIPQILINGVRRSHDDLNALDPQDILKVEYITYPDIRYSAPYINIVTVRNPTGGSLMADLRAPVTTRQENHQLYASYRRGKHEVSVNYRGTFRDTRGDHTDLTEWYFAPDRTYETEMRGLPSRVLDRSHDASVEYSLVGGPKRMLVTTASIGC